MRAAIHAGFVLGLLVVPAVLPAGEQITIRSPNQAAPNVDATVQMKGGLIAVGVGYGWARGVINYDGAQQAFCIRGLSVGDVGAVRLQSNGWVFNLHSLEDFSGKYFSLSIGAALSGGASATLLKNEHGVTMQLDTRMQGIRFSLAAAGVKITLAGRRGCE